MEHKVKEHPSYYSILTADVRYCKELSAQEKLLYSEITALTNKQGYCWATNNYFAELYGLSKDRISRQISNLAKHGFINIQMIYVEGTKQIKERRIYLSKTPRNDDVYNANTPIGENANTPIGENANTPIGENTNTPIGENTNTPIGENTKGNSTSRNTKKSNITRGSNIKVNVRVTSDVPKKNKPKENLTIDNDVDLDNDIIPDKEPVIIQNANKTTSAPKQDNNHTDIPPVYDYDTYKAIIHKNISYSHLKQHSDPLDIRMIDELVENMLDVITTQSKTIQIYSETKDRQVVINRYLALHAGHIQHVMMKYQEQVGKITHISAYLKTLLYTVKQECDFSKHNYLRYKGMI